MLSSVSPILIGIVLVIVAGGLCFYGVFSVIDGVKHRKMRLRLDGWGIDHHHLSGPDLELAYIDAASKMIMAAKKGIV